MNNLIVIIDDLIFKTKINTILNNLNKSVEFINDPNEVEFHFLKEQPSLIIIDLEIKNLDFDFLAHQKNMFGEKLYLLGFCSHIKTDLMNSAVESGFDLVIPRSKFVKDLPKIIKNFDIQH